MKTSIIIDDEQHGIDALKWKIEVNLPSIKILDTFVNGLEACEYLKEKEVDIIFLDIEMPIINGIELAKEFSENSKIIFTTAHSHYMLEAIREQAFDYLLKPIDVIELKNTIKRIYQSNQKNKNHSDKNVITVNTSESIIYIKELDIIYCKSFSNYTTLFLINGSRQVISKTLMAVELQLSNDFIRIHNSYVVNKSHVLRYNKGVGGSVTLVDNTELAVSKSRKNTVLSSLGQ